MKVRIPVYMDSNGDWVAYGCSRSDDKAQRRHAREMLAIHTNTDIDDIALHYVEAEVQQHQPRVIDGVIPVEGAVAS